MQSVRETLTYFSKSEPPFTLEITTAPKADCLDVKKAASLRLVDVAMSRRTPSEKKTVLLTEL